MRIILLSLLAISLWLMPCRAMDAFPSVLWTFTAATGGRIQKVVSSLRDVDMCIKEFGVRDVFLLASTSKHQAAFVYCIEQYSTETLPLLGVMQEVIRLGDTELLTLALEHVQEFNGCEPNILDALFSVNTPHKEELLAVLLAYPLFDPGIGPYGLRPIKWLRIACSGRYDVSKLILLLMQCGRFDAATMLHYEIKLNGKHFFDSCDDAGNLVHLGLANVIPWKDLPDPNLPKDSQTLLHAVIGESVHSQEEKFRKAQLSIVLQLLQNPRIDINRQDGDGRTPLDCAIEKKLDDVIDALLLYKPTISPVAIRKRIQAKDYACALKLASKATITGNDISKDDMQYLVFQSRASSFKEKTIALYLLAHLNIDEAAQQHMVDTSHNPDLIPYKSLIPRVRDFWSSYKTRLMVGVGILCGACGIYCYWKTKKTEKAKKEEQEEATEDDAIPEPVMKRFEMA